MRTNKHPPPSLQLSPFHHSMLQCLLDLDWEAVWTKTILILIRTKRPSGQKENKNSPPSILTYPTPDDHPHLLTHIYHSPSFLYSVLPSTSCASSKQNKSKNQQKQNYTTKRPKQRPSTLTHTRTYIYHIDQYWWLNSDAMEIERGVTPIFFFFHLVTRIPSPPSPNPLPHTKQTSTHLPYTGKTSFQPLQTRS